MDNRYNPLYPIPSLPPNDNYQNQRPYPHTLPFEQPVPQVQFPVAAPRKILQPKGFKQRVPSVPTYNFVNTFGTFTAPQLISSGMDKRSPSSFQQLEKVFLSPLIYRLRLANRFHSSARVPMPRYGRPNLYMPLPFKLTRDSQGFQRAKSPNR